ncbi:MAG TPA: methyltransferase domain-containing protein [Steroidobacteraceae bacterium]|nr:methyltransferase domain-containing protein [Steroidobacteraceae bacterium]
MAQVPHSRRRLHFAAMALLGFGALAAAGALADIYDDAVAHPGRSAEDLRRDPIDRPADMLRLAGLKPGMQVADFMAADGYYSELASYVVGPKGHVLLLNNPTWDYWSGNHWKERIAGRLPNVEHRTIDAEHIDVPDGSQDAVLLIKAYHDFYAIDDDPQAKWPRFDVARVVSSVARMLKPGGTLLLIDHSARPGTATADATSLHRVDEAYTRREFEQHGFKLVRTSDLLRRADDARDAISYKGAMVGKTDRFVLVFRKDG